MDRRYGRVKWGRGQARQRTSPDNWKLPRRWNKTEFILQDGIHMRRQRVFCASLSDWLDDEVPIEWLADLLHLIRNTPNLDWQLLTKRPENWRMRLLMANGWCAREGDLEKFETCPRMQTAFWIGDWLNGKPPENVWVGVSAEDQKNYNLRAPLLAEIPARIHFISAEPLLGPILFNIPPTEKWVIFGGESGANARPCAIEWIQYGIRQCQGVGVHPFVKQLGSKPVWNHIVPGCSVRERIEPLRLKHKKGEDPSEWPIELRVREFPQ